ncbi:MAG: hypothetical protein O9341_16335, partial [Paucibacter sp.]|nr:hypothetical protein [Roseateles sp.]
GTVVKLYHSATGQIVVAKDAPVSGADGAITLDAFSGNVPAADALRFKYVAAGGVFQVREADLPRLPQLHTQQLVLVQENAAGQVQNASTAQIAGALDDLYSAAAEVNDYGATVKNGRTQFKLWAPTAQAVQVIVTAPSSNPFLSRSQTVDLQRDPATGAWSASLAGEFNGRSYRYAVTVFVRGVGLVRSLVTDPYSLALTLGSQQSVVADLQSASFKPAGWDASQPPATVQATPDMSIYELHVRDFSVNDASVPADKRGKYLAFAEGNSNGMKHLRALAQSGLTDVHLLPVFDIASVPEKGCVTPNPSGSADGEAQQALVSATAGSDCFNWGYDPYHFTAPEGSYASSVADPAARVVEFRRMVQALNAAGLRVGMDILQPHQCLGPEQRLGVGQGGARLLPPPERQRRHRALHLLREHRGREPHDGQADDRLGHRLGARLSHQLAALRHHGAPPALGDGGSQGRRRTRQRPPGADPR